MPAVPNASVTPQHIYIGGNALQDVSSFFYLGSAITPNNDMQEEIDLRVAKSRRAYHMLSQRLRRQPGYVGGQKSCTERAHGRGRSLKRRGWRVCIIVLLDVCWE